MFSPRAGLSWFSVAISLVVVAFFAAGVGFDLREPGPLRVLNLLLDLAFLGLAVFQLVNDLWWRATRNWARLVATGFALAAGVLIVVWGYAQGASTHLGAVICGAIWFLLALACLVTEVRSFSDQSTAA